MPEHRDLLHNLNSAQVSAVTSEAPNVLVVAGAGSGKTRVLVHRLAWMIERGGYLPHQLLAVTFTNKAAGEMRQRVIDLLAYPGRGLWVGTFHSIAHRLLRLHHSAAGLKSDFQIIDADDQHRLVRRILKEQQIDEKTLSIKRAQWYINEAKDSGQRPNQMVPGESRAEQLLHQIYVGYEETRERAGLVDFAELLLRAHELWLHQPQLLAHYQQRFRQLLVDEFQDTNTIQYAWIRVLAGETGEVFAVGDDDQSIYSWRGAQAENLERFRKDYRAVDLVRLEQNYRSTTAILDAANAVISHNPERVVKSLWTDRGQGLPVSLYGAYNELDEAHFCAERAQQWVSQGGALSEVALLYRSNAQSRALEQAFHQKQIPYRIYGGVRFFERAEIKDLLAYLRLMTNRSDDSAFERIINLPTRGIGARTLERIRNHAKVTDRTLWLAANSLLEQQQLSGRARSAVTGFLELINSMASDNDTSSLGERVEQSLATTQLEQHYLSEPPEKAQGRIENLKELVTAASHYVLSEDDELAGLTELQAFLADVALEAGAHSDQEGDVVQMMTVHSAKGLEYPLVIVTGMEQGLFPTRRSLEPGGNIAEERRLCYVAMTRAMDQLILCHAVCRRLYGKETPAMPSRFLDEIPEELIIPINPGNLHRQAAPARRRGPQAGLFEPGASVNHPIFGIGMVIGYEGQGAHTQVEVNFERDGIKMLVLAYAGLTSAQE